MLVGGKFVSLCSLESDGEGVYLSPEKSEGSARRASEPDKQWKEIFSTKVASAVIHLKFSPDGEMFASAAEVREHVTQE